jgi:hypothetical protein
VPGLARLAAVAARRGLAQVGRQLGVQRRRHHPLGERLPQPMLAYTIVGVGIIWQHGLEQRIVCGLRTGHLLLLVVVCLEDNQLHS